MSKPSLKAMKNYQKYLGKMVSQSVKKQIPGFVTPEFYPSNYYVRTGNIIVLYADEAYFSKFSNDPENPNIWQHHFPEQYLFLTEQLKTTP